VKLVEVSRKIFVSVILYPCHIFERHQVMMRPARARVLAILFFAKICRIEQNAEEAMRSSLAELARRLWHPLFRNSRNNRKAM